MCWNSGPKRKFERLTWRRASLPVHILTSYHHNLNRQWLIHLVLLLNLDLMTSQPPSLGQRNRKLSGFNFLGDCLLTPKLSPNRLIVDDAANDDNSGAI